MARRNTINHGNAVATRKRYTSTNQQLHKYPWTATEEETMAAIEDSEDSLPKISIVVLEVGASDRSWLGGYLSIYRMLLALYKPGPRRTKLYSRI